MKDLFYFAKDQQLVWVSGYDALENQNDIDKQIESLRKNKRKLISQLDFFTQVFHYLWIKRIVVKSYYIQNSSRYKYMRVFWCNVKYMSVIPNTDVYLIEPNSNWSDDQQWTMWKWITR